MKCEDCGKEIKYSQTDREGRHFCNQQCVQNYHFRPLLEKYRKELGDDVWL